MYENDKLLNRILEPPKVEVPPVQEEPQVTRPRMIPWNVRKQMLEREDREKAKLMREFESTNQKESIEDLEKEIGVAES
jgi:hypothetical protein